MTGTEKSPSEICDFRENHTDTTVSFTVTSTKEKIDAFEKGKDGLIGKFKLSTTISIKNMTLFDHQGKIHKYAASLDILRFFFQHRLEFYVKRKAMLLDKMGKELKVLSNKARFVEEVCSGDLVVSNRKRKELLSDLQERGYDLFPRDEKKDPEEEDEDDESVEENVSDAELAKGYEYLLGMKIWSLTHEKVSLDHFHCFHTHFADHISHISLPQQHEKAAALRSQKAEKTEEVKKLEATSPEAIWLTDLDAIDEALDERDMVIVAEAKKEIQAQSKSKARSSKKKTIAAKKSKKAAKKKDEWDSDLELSDDDDDFMPAPKPRAAPKKPAAKKPTAKPAAKAPPAPTSLSYTLLV